MSNKVKVRIVGGSIGGLFAAIFLDQQGFDVRVYERSGLDLSGRGAGLSAGQELFDALRQIGFGEVGELCVVSKGQVILDKEGRVAGSHASRGARFSWDVLYGAARSMLSDDQYVNNRHVSHVKNGDRSATLIFDDGSEETADLVIGADGIASVVRKALNPIVHENRFAGYAAWRIFIPEERLPADLKSWSEDLVGFTEPGIQAIGYMVPGPEGQIEPGRRRYSWGWYRPSTKLALTELFTEGARSFEHSLPPGRMSDSRVEQFQREAAIALPPQFASVTRAGFKPWVQGIFDYRPGTIAEKRVVLLGDAAALARPHVGLGTSKAAGDAMALARALSGFASIDDAVLTYGRERLPYGQDLVQSSIEIGTSLRLGTLLADERGS